MSAETKDNRQRIELAQAGVRKGPVGQEQLHELLPSYKFTRRPCRSWHGTKLYAASRWESCGVSVSMKSTDGSNRKSRASVKSLIAV